ncbi:MAG: translation elongation factor Ts [Candidatus Nomurabacteria bacterium]|jgi:elongation factor Ts|nr:translation elongation factor Ts [Candidatus Nomurabacteria bacterium]
MAVSLDEVKKLKELTGLGLTDAKKALEEAKGDFDKAVKALREKGLTKAEKRGQREAREGVIESYVHSGRIGVLVEVNCETDFVAKNDIFKNLAHEIALQIASMNPKYISADDIPAEVYSEKKAELVKAAEESGKPKEVAEKMIDGQLKKYFAEQVLLTQVFWKDDSKTIDDIVKDAIMKLGENIRVSQMARIELGVSE